MIRKEKKAIRAKAKAENRDYFDVQVEYIKIKTKMVKQAKKGCLYGQLKRYIPGMAIMELKAA